MALQTSTLTMTGKVGNVVGMKGFGGKFNARIYVPGENINDAKTSEQVYQRSKLALAAKVAAMLGVMGEQVNVANGLKASRRGALVRNIMAYINDAVAGPQLAADLSIVKNPKASVSVTDRSVGVTAPTALTNGRAVYGPSVSADEGTLRRHIVALLVYNTVKDDWRSQVRVVPQGSENKVTLYFPNSWAGDAVIFYGYTLAMTTDPSIAGVVSSFGNLTGTEDNISIPVDSTGVAYGSLLFSQIDTYVIGQSIAPIGG